MKQQTREERQQIQRRQRRQRRKRAATFYCDICCGGRANPTMSGRLIVV